VIAISEFNRSHVEALRTCLPEAISMIHCGIDLTKFEGQPFVERARHNGDPVRILSVGSLVPKKGHRYLIEACHLLHERGMDFTCTIIGGGPDESVLRQLISAWDLQNQVELRGARPQSEIIAAYHQHDVFVLASIVAPNGDRDGIPVVLMEAGKVGLPLISTAVSGIPELVRQDQTGWLVPPGDATALADAIAALATDPATRARLGCNARVLVEEQFSIECNTLRLAALFHDTYQQWNHGIPDTHHD
jgi:glycosyltransferase involved in cell wall biosynthesis